MGIRFFTSAITIAKIAVSFKKIRRKPVYFIYKAEGCILKEDKSQDHTLIKDYKLTGDHNEDYKTTYNSDNIQNLSSSVYCARNAMNHHPGMTADVDFRQTANGKLPTGASSIMS